MMRAALRLVLPALAMALLVAPLRAEEAKPPAAPPADWARLVPDLYDGHIASGPGLLKGATEFVARDGKIIGRYGFSEVGGEIVEGTLDTCVVAGPYRMTCRWHDKYGSGTLQLRFEESLQSFVGAWRSDDGKSKFLPWLGQRRIGS